MSRNIRVAVTSLATLEAVAPPYNLAPTDAAQNLERGITILEAAGAQGVDLACLPEGFMAGGMSGEQMRLVAEPIQGPAYERVAAQARKYSMNIVAGFYVLEGDKLSNVAVLIDRAGELIGTYKKQFPTPGEIAHGVDPGDSQSVFELDFGRIGLAICFDLNWPPLWSHFASLDVDLVCWLSAYDGGFPLRAYAWAHQYPIATSVLSYHGRVIDIMGNYAASTSRWTRLAVCDINLEKRLFHTDGQAQKILELQKHYGSRISIQGYTEEHVFSIEPLDDTLTIGEIIREHSLTDLRSYIRESEEARSAALTSE